MLGVAPQYCLWQMSKCWLPQGKCECSLEDARFWEIWLWVVLCYVRSAHSGGPTTGGPLHKLLLQVPLPDDQSSWVEDWEDCLSWLPSEVSTLPIGYLSSLSQWTLGVVGCSVADVSLFCYLKCRAYQQVCYLSRCPTREPRPASLPRKSFWPLPWLWHSL